MNRVQIKICGITTVADARRAAAAGADFLGFVLFPGSPRCVTPTRIRRIVEALRRPVLKVGVFVNAAPAEIEAAMATAGLDLAQLHGTEPESVARRIGAERVWKGLALNQEADVAAAAHYPAAAVVVDAIRPGAWGGTGELSNWDMAAALARRCRVVLAGGLTPTNVGRAIADVQPFAVDVSSGVESRPGCKDHERVRAFVAAVRASADSRNDAN